MADKTTTGRGAALWALFALLAAVYLVTGSGRFHIVDEVSLFSVTESVAKRGAFDTNAIAWTQWVNSPGEVLGAFGPQGDDFSKKGPAPAILAVPFYLIGWLAAVCPSTALRLSMLQTAFWLNAVVTALTGVLLAQAVLALGYSFRAAVLAGAVFGLGTIAWPYATHFFGEPVSALAIFGLFYTLLRLRQTGAPRYTLLGGLAAGVMITTSAWHAVLLAPFGVYLLYATHLWARRRAAGEDGWFPRGDPLSVVCCWASARLCCAAGGPGGVAGALQPRPLRHPSQHGLSLSSRARASTPTGCWGCGGCSSARTTASSGTRHWRSSACWRGPASSAATTPRAG